MPTKLALVKETPASKTAKTAQAATKEVSPTEEGSLYEPQASKGNDFAFGVKLFLIAAAVIVLFWFLNKSV